MWQVFYLAPLLEPVSVLRLFRKAQALTARERLKRSDDSPPTPVFKGPLFRRSVRAPRVASFILSRVCLKQLVVDLYCLLSAVVALSLLYLKQQKLAFIKTKLPPILLF